MRSTPCVVTFSPLRSTLAYGPISTITLSASVLTFAATGDRPGNITNHDPSLSVIVYVTSVLSPASFMAFTFHLPLRSAAEIGVGAGGAGGGAGAAADMAVSGEAALFSDFEQAPRITAQQHVKARQRIVSPFSGVVRMP